MSKLLSDKFSIVRPRQCYDKCVDFSSLLGEVILEINLEDEVIEFVTKDSYYILYHDYDCCESVYVESVVGDINNLIGRPILLAEEIVSYENPIDVEYDDSFTWTFYKIATIKGYVDIRWYGTSNGYYSESVSLLKLPLPK